MLNKCQGGIKRLFTYFMFELFLNSSNSLMIFLTPNSKSMKRLVYMHFFVEEETVLIFVREGNYSLGVNN